MRVGKVLYEISFMKLNQRGLRESKIIMNDPTVEDIDRYENFLPFRQLSGYIGSYNRKLLFYCLFFFFLVLFLG